MHQFSPGPCWGTSVSPSDSLTQLDTPNYI